MSNNSLILSKFQEQFPHCWFKDGQEFDGSINRVLWTGEGGEIDGLPAYSMELWPENFGVHPQLIEFGDANNIYFEAYDSGTLFGYWA